MRGRCILAILVVSLGASEGLRWPKIFKDGMVLQAGPTPAILWGFLDGVANEVTLTASCGFGPESTTITKKTFSPNKDDTKFKLEFPGEHGLICSFDLDQEGGNPNRLTLNFVTFGDVWVCSGQSNMEWRLDATFNAAAEIADIANYPNIKLYRVDHLGHPEPQDDLLSEHVQSKHWGRTNDTYFVSQFSAICLLTIKYMSEQLPEKHFGLVETNWGGTRIEPWMTPEGLIACDIVPYVDANGNVGNSDTYLYNAMIHPLVRMSIKGVLWYQGESNGEWNRDKYQCTFPAMISEWRRIWSQMTPTAKEFPFGFVQISTWEANDKSPNFPMIRWHQTGNFGYVPNDVMKNVFMGVAIDTYDQESGIHPRNKQLPAKRLATAGLNVAYGVFTNPTNGPFPESIAFTLVIDGFDAVIDYNQDFTWSPIESSGFYYCCEADYQNCNMVIGAWTAINAGDIFVSGRRIQMKLGMCATGLAYLWETTPVLGTAALPIYANDGFQLPGAPWMYQVAV